MRNLWLTFNLFCVGFDICVALLSMFDVGRLLLWGEVLLIVPPDRNRQPAQHCGFNIYYFTFNGIGNQPAFSSCKSDMVLFCVEVVYCLMVLGPAIWTGVSTYVLIELTDGNQFHGLRDPWFLFVSSILVMTQDFLFSWCVLYEWDNFSWMTKSP